VLKYLTATAFILTLFSASASQTTAQKKYLYHQHKAKIFFADSAYLRAAHEYQLAFKYRIDFALDQFTCAVCFDHLDSTRQALHYLQLSITTGMDLQDAGDLFPHLKKHGLFPTQKQIDSLQQKFYSNCNKDYVLQLKEMVDADQAVRINGRLEPGNVDSVNMEKLKLLFAKYGAPTYATVGYVGETYVFILLLHGLFDHVNDSADWAYFEPLLRQTVLSGEVVPEHYALLYDRVYSDYGIAQVYYGVQYSIDATGSFLLTPIYDIAHVDKRRQKIGLASLRDDLHIVKMKWPEGYKGK